MMPMMSRQRWRAAAAAAAVVVLATLAAVGGLAAAGAEPPQRRRVQGKPHRPPPSPPPAAPADQPLCSQLAERGALLCDADAELCPVACAAPAPAPAPPAWCAELDCSSSGEAELCPDSCAADDADDFFRTNCLVLLKLDGGCAYDLSQEDSALPSGTRVSDVCPDACSGHGQCLPSAVDIAFLGSYEDTSGNGGAVALAGPQGGAACVDDGGVTFDGDSWATIPPGVNYGNGAEFTIPLWLVVAAEDVWTPHDERVGRLRHVFSHGPRVQSSVAGGISVSISRQAWLDAWTLRVSIAGTDADHSLNLIRDDTPKWTHVAIAFGPSDLRVFEDGRPIKSSKNTAATVRRFTGAMDLAGDAYLGGSPATFGW